MDFVSYEKLAPAQQVLGSYGFDRINREQDRQWKHVKGRGSSLYPHVSPQMSSFFLAPLLLANICSPCTPHFFLHPYYLRVPAKQTT